MWRVNANAWARRAIHLLTPAAVVNGPRKFMKKEGAKLGTRGRTLGVELSCQELILITN